ncbi:MAG TPA: hypothetical protein VMM17_12100 [Gemmatimonadaceae bacterium]|nr:hypothetical protein [Gemmatimonadaceae bacterium]
MRIHSRQRRVLAATVAAMMIGVATSCGPRDRDTNGDAAGTDTALRVGNVTLGRSIGADNRVTNRTAEFAARDTIYAAVETNRSSAGGTLAARWKFEDGQMVDESSRNIAANAESVTEFHITNPNGWPAGRYTVEILIDGAPARTEVFTVR